jgi:hypothetical protein
MKNTDQSSPQLNLRLHAGDFVEVRSEAEILATLDETGALDNLPFMPEMLEYCGKRFKVAKRADKTCDTINYGGSRRMLNTVILEGARCNGSSHGGCQALCTLFWKEAWLKRADAALGSKRAGGKKQLPVVLVAARCDRVALQSATRRSADDSGEEVQYRCQATDLLLASSSMARWDVRQYVRDVRSGNVTIGALMDAILFNLVRYLLHARWFRGYRVLKSAYNRFQSWRGGPAYPDHQGSLTQTPKQTLELNVGECVRIKSQADILQTVDGRGRNKGLSFDKEMVPYCGTEQRVLARVERIIDERSGKMISMSKDCIILEGVTCQALYSEKRLFCPRALYPFWREIWLERTAEADTLENERPKVAAGRSNDMTPTVHEVL